MSNPDDGVKITVSETGSLKIEGPVSLFAHDGTPLPTREGKALFLCRCGASNNKPYCDGTHKTHEWDCTLADR